MGFKVHSGTEKILTVIGKDTAIIGTLQGPGSVRIDGRVQGEVDVEGEVIIGEGAVIEATVKGKNVQVAGHLTGNIVARGLLEILATGLVIGDVDVQSLKVADGAVFRGACLMHQPEMTKI